MPSGGAKSAALVYTPVELRNGLRYPGSPVLPESRTSPLVVPDSFPNLKIHSGRKM